MLNHIDIMGRMVRDPELRRTGSGIAVASFTVAVDRDIKQNGEKETDFFDCVAWRQTGEFVSKYFRKGSLIVVSGRLQIKSWTDKDGNKRKAPEIVAENCYFGESKKSTDGGSALSGGYTGGNVFPETAAQLDRLQQNQDYNYPYPGVTVQGGDYDLLDDDGQLPF